MDTGAQITGDGGQRDIRNRRIEYVHEYRQRQHQTADRSFGTT